MAKRRDTLDTSFHQALEAWWVEDLQGGIRVVRNGINIEGSRIMFVSTQHHTITILPKIHQVIGVSQIRNVDSFGEFEQWCRQGILMLHRNERNGDANHTTNPR